MASFKLPRLKANLAVVNSKGQPLDYFLRLFNIETAQRLETIINDQQALLDAIIAAQAAADAAQATADEALAAAGEAGGARYANLSATAPAIEASVTVSGVTADTRLSVEGVLFGGTLDANAPLVGTLTLRETNGVTPLVIDTAPLTVNSTGISPGPGEWNAETASIAMSGVGVYTGTVTYLLRWDRTSGSNYVILPDINSVLTITPKAMP